MQKEEKENKMWMDGDKVEHEEASHLKGRFVGPLPLLLLVLLLVVLIFLAVALKQEVVSAPHHCGRKASVRTKPADRSFGRW